MSRTVTSRSQVRKIIALIDKLPITQPGVIPTCPPRPAGVPTVTFTFRGSNHNRVLALARVRADVANTTTNCGEMRFSIDGHTVRPLGLARGFLRSVQQLLGIQLISRAGP